MNLFLSINENVSDYTWLVGNLVLAVAFFVSIIDFKKKLKIAYHFGIVFVVAVLFGVLALFHVLPDLSNGSQYLYLRTLFQLLVVTLYFVSIVLFLLNKSLSQNSNLKSVLISLVLLFVSEVMMLSHFQPGNLLVSFGLIVRFLGLIILLYSLIRYNLVEPYNDLYDELVKENSLQKNLQHSIKVSYLRLSRSQQIGHVGSWELDLTTMKIWASDEAFRIYGLEIPKDRILPLKEVQELVSIEDRPRLDLALMNLIKRGEEYNVTYSIHTTSGSLRYINSVATLKRKNGIPTMVYGVVNDITKLKLEENKLLYQSMHDHLTDLYNRRYFMRQREILNQDTYLPVATVILDINGLKIINDSFGHHIGNRVLKRLASILTENFKDTTGFVSRIGGDEFAIMKPNTSKESIEAIMEDIIHILSQEKVGNINLSVAYGIEVRENLDESFDEVLKKAEDEMYLYKISNSQSVRNKMTDALLKTLYEKDYISEEHSQRVSNYAYLLAKACKLSLKIANDIKIAGLLHDIGKITIGNQILNKKGRLTDREYDIIKTHPEKGYKIIHSIGDMDIIANYVLEHHEFYNGNGYPKGLKGKDISLESRIITIADSYDAMTSFREYHAIKTKEEAIAELLACKGTQFDPDLVDVFIHSVLNAETDGQE